MRPGEDPVGGGGGGGGPSACFTTLAGKHCIR